MIWIGKSLRIIRIGEGEHEYEDPILAQEYQIGIINNERQISVKHQTPSFGWSGEWRVSWRSNPIGFEIWQNFDWQER